MRNPSRIMSVCSMVERVWREDFPDLRFMQLMSDFTLWYGDDPFYMEDDVFMIKFLDFATEMNYVHAPSVIHKTPDGASYM